MLFDERRVRGLDEVTFFFFFSLQPLKCCISGSVTIGWCGNSVVLLLSSVFFQVLTSMGAPCNRGWGLLAGYAVMVASCL